MDHPFDGTLFLSCQAPSSRSHPFTFCFSHSVCFFPEDQWLNHQQRLVGKKNAIWEENRCGKFCWITIFNGSVQVILQKTMIFSFKKGGVPWIFPSTNSLGHLLHDIPLTFTLTPSSSKVFPHPEPWLCCCLFPIWVNGNRKTGG